MSSNVAFEQGILLGERLPDFDDMRNKFAEDILEDETLTSFPSLKEDEDEDENKMNIFAYTLILLIILGGGGYAIYKNVGGKNTKKKYKKKKRINKTKKK